MKIFKNPAVLVITILVLFFGSIQVWSYCMKDYNEFQEAAHSFDIKDLKDYIAQNPKPKYYDEALIFLDDRTFHENNTGFGEYFTNPLETVYLVKYPNGRHAKEAIDILAVGRLKKAIDDNDVFLAAETLQKFPNSSSDKSLRNFIAAKFEKADLMLKEKSSLGAYVPVEDFVSLFESMKKDFRCELPLVFLIKNEVKDWTSFSTATQNSIAADRPYVEDSQALLREYTDPHRDINMIINPDGYKDRTNLIPNIKDSPPTPTSEYLNAKAYHILADSLAQYLTDLFQLVLGEKVINVVPHDSIELPALSKTGVLVFTSRLVNSKNGGLPQVYYSHWERMGSGEFDGYSLGIGTIFTGKLIIPGGKGFSCTDEVSPSSSIQCDGRVTNPYMPVLANVFKSAAQKTVVKMGFPAQ